MTKERRYLQFGNLEAGELVYAQCSACDRMFLARPANEDRIDDLILRVRAEFDAHHCNGSTVS
ncbi:MAG TPA: hypothetical protein VND65_00345 [Candidatus Binatia bacterium]|nr:hypothetical protein [Candidatus Binatia bacterium]